MDDRELQKWERLEAQRNGRSGESLLEAVGYRPPTSMRLPAPSPGPQLDEEPSWDGGQAPYDDSGRRVQCVFIWLADEPQGKVLARDHRVLVEVADQAREKHARDILPEDRVILSTGSSRWSPADEFTEAVVQAIEASHPQLVRDAREWRRALSELQASRHWTIEELREHLADAGVHRELPTLEGWLRIDQAAPIGPLHIADDLLSMWPLITTQTERTIDEVAEACKRLRSLRGAAGRALLKLWKGSTKYLGIDEAALEGLVEQLHQEVQVQAYAVEAISRGIVPGAMLGWWVTPELASNFEVLSEAAEDDQ